MKPYSVDSQKWQLFPDTVQLQNIGAELSRAMHASARGDSELEEGAYYRALALFDATIPLREGGERMRLQTYRDAVAALLGRGEYGAVARVLLSGIKSTA